MSKRKEEKKFNFATLSRSVPPSGEIEKRREKGEGKKKKNSHRQGKLNRVTKKHNTGEQLRGRGPKRKK